MNPKPFLHLIDNALLTITFIILSMCVMSARPVVAAGYNDELNVFDTNDGNALLWEYMKTTGDALPARQFPPGSLEEWESRRPELLRRVLRALDIDDIEKTPLNAETRGVVEFDDFTVEKIIYESRPGFYVTGNLYKPKGAAGRLPVLLWLHGHNELAKAGYGWPMQMLVRNGIMVFAKDGPGAGERKDIEHSNIAPCWPVGSSVKTFEIWDNIRAVDYLESRPDVDPGRIGCAGRSGGGTQTLVMAAVEPRFRAAVVMAGASTFQQSYVYKPPEHCVCNYYPAALRYFNVADLLSLAAPGMLVFITSGMLDPIFPHPGALESVNQARAVYKLYGAENRFIDFFDGGMHDATDAQIKRTIRFLVKALNPDSKKTVLPDHEIIPPEKLEAGFPSKYKTAIDFCRDEARRLEVPRPKDTGEWQSISAGLRDNIVNDIFGGFPEPAPLNARLHGNIDREKYTIEKISYETEPGLRLPMLVFTPHGGAAKKPAVIVLLHGGKNTIESEPLFEEKINAGWIVAGPDLRGLGEQAPLPQGKLSANYNYVDYMLATSAMLMGRPLLATRVHDTRKTIDYLLFRSDVDTEKVSIYGRDGTSYVALFTAALDDRIAAATIENLPASFFPSKRNPIAFPMDFYLPGIMNIADIPHIAGMIAPRPLKIIGVYSIHRILLDSESAEKEFRQTGYIYSLFKDKSGALEIE